MLLEFDKKNLTAHSSKIVSLFETKFDEIIAYCVSFQKIITHIIWSFEATVASNQSLEVEVGIREE